MCTVGSTSKCNSAVHAGQRRDLQVASMRISLNVDQDVVKLLKVLSPTGNVKEVLEELIDHAQEGVYRPGSWERRWIIQAFGDDFQKRLETWPDMPGNFQRPRL